MTYGSIPQNSGLTRPIEIVAPKGSLANPIFPAPVIARFCPGNQLADTVMKALAQAVPEQVSAGIGNLRVIAFSGLNEGNHWVHMEILEGSYGGRNGLDGMDAVDTLYANTRNNPIEDIESHLPLRVERYELRNDAVAAGQWRGGIGTMREFTYLVDGGFSVEGDGHKYRPWGFMGGKEGHTASLRLRQQAGQGDRARLQGALPQGQGGRSSRLVRSLRRRLWRPAEAQPGTGALRRARRPHLSGNRAQGLRRGHRRQGGGPQGDQRRALERGLIDAQTSSFERY